MKAVSSHQFRYPVPQVPGYIFFDLCFLRDPIDRIRSMYDYFREKPIPGEPASDLAREQPIGGFIAGLVEHHTYRVSNVQVNLLANGIVNDPPAEADLVRATEVMLKTSFLGVVDCFHESLVAGQYFLRPVFPNLALAQQPANVSSGLADGDIPEACDAGCLCRAGAAERARFRTCEPRPGGSASPVFDGSGGSARLRELQTLMAGDKTDRPT